MRFAGKVIALGATIAVAGLAAFTLTKRNIVSQDFSANDFETLVVQSMGEAAAVFGAAAPVEQGTFDEAKAVYVMRYTHGAVTLFINGVNINSARADLEKRLGVACTENPDFEDLPSRAGIMLGKLSYTCTKADEKNFAGYVLMIDEDARVSHLYQVVGHGVPQDIAKTVIDRVYAHLKQDYANWLAI